MSLKIGIGLIACCLWLGCVKIPETVPLPTKLCLRVQHHAQPVPKTKILFKFNTDVFPGYDLPDTFYDTIFYADKNANLCYPSIPEGTHWLTGYGYDSLYFPHNVLGCMRVTIDLSTQPKVDTIFYISE